MELCCHRRVLGRKPSTKPFQVPACSLWQGEASREVTQTPSAMNPTCHLARHCWAPVEQDVFMLKCTGPSNRNKNYLHVCGLSMLLSISCTLLYWSFRRSYEAVMQSQAHQALPLAPAWHARGRSREHPMPDRNHTVPCGFYTGNQILLSHLQMGFWR